jgi:DNA-binding MarR family transcriptional regulator
MVFQMKFKQLNLQAFKSKPMNHTDIIIHIRKIVRSLNLESRRILKEFGVSIPQLLCLQFLSSRPHQKATHKEVALYLNLNSSTVTGIIGRLEKKGFVLRTQADGDKRVSYIFISDSGLKLLNESPELLHHQLLQKLKQLPDISLTQIDDSLKMLIACMGIGQTDASPVLTIEEPINKTDL